jgi:DNA-directed RNA polymerase subunit RPC12/RpoP
MEALECSECGESFAAEPDEDSQVTCEHCGALLLVNGDGSTSVLEGAPEGL